MPQIVAAPFFLLLLAASGRAIDSSRSLLSVRDVENIRTAKEYASHCKLKHGEHNLHVYHIYQGGSGWGLAERNAGDSVGDLSFVFPRGFSAYYKGGYIAMTHASYNHFDTYLQCNHAKGSHKYSCLPGGHKHPGRERAHGSAGHQGYWYSFPRAGKDIHWWESQGSSGTCGYIRISAKCLFNLMAKAGGRCSHGCDGKSYDECSKCIRGLSISHERQLWDHAIWNHGCKRHEPEARRRRRRHLNDDLNDDLDDDLNDDLNATSELDDPVMPEGFSTVSEEMPDESPHAEKPTDQDEGHNATRNLVV